MRNFPLIDENLRHIRIKNESEREKTAEYEYIATLMWLKFQWIPNSFKILWFLFLLFNEFIQIEIKKKDSKPIETINKKKEEKTNKLN